MSFMRKVLTASTISLVVSLGASTHGWSQANDKNVLRVAMSGDLKITDPVWTAAAITGIASNQIYDMLFAPDEKLEMQNQMVGEYTVSEDRLTHTFKLRTGLKFHDGAPVTAEDCVVSIKRWAERDAMGRLMMSNASSLEVVSEDTFKLVLTEPFGLVREALGKRIGPAYIRPARLASVPASEEIKDPIGSGPYKIVMDEWIPGSKVVFAKNEHYVPRDEEPNGLAGAKVVNFDRMEWVSIPDVNTKLTALTVGEIDYFDAPPLDFLPLFDADPNLKLVATDPLGIQPLLRPNHLYPPFDNKLARQALALLIKQEDVLKAIVGDRPDLYPPYCPAYFMCGTTNESSAGAEPFKEVNVEKAKALLKEAGYNGEPLVIMQPTDRPEHTAATLVVIQALRDAGINLDVQAADWATISARRAQKTDPKDGGWHLFITGTTAAAAIDPLVNLWFVPSCDGAAPGWPCDEEIMGWIGEWSREDDAAKKKELIDRIHAKAYDTIPYVILGQYKRQHGVREELKGVSQAGTTVFWGMYK